jgi:hypothetical protein
MIILNKNKYNLSFDMTTGVCMRSMAGNSRAMVAVAMWKEDGVIHHN